MIRTKSKLPRQLNAAKAGTLTAPCKVAGAVALLGSFFLVSAPMRATSVVALIDRQKNRLVLAADCSVNRNHDSVSQCKIIEERNCVVAIAGLYEEPTTGFHLRQLIHAACQEAGDLRAKADTFLRNAKAPYEKLAAVILKEDPIYFHRILENKSTEVIFAGLQKGHLALFVRGFVADSTGRVTTESYESLDSTSSPIGYFSGLNDHNKAYVQSQDGWKTNYASAARKFVEMEIQAHPELAGPPISEIVIDGGGKVKWLSQGACAHDLHNQR